MKPNLYQRSFFLLLICFFLAGIFSQSVFADDYWIWPLAGTTTDPYYISQYWKQYNIVNGQIQYNDNGWAVGGHNGIDIRIPGVENLEVYAAKAGTVVVSGDCGPGATDWYGNTMQGAGNFIIIDHHNGYFSHYAHLNQRFVEAGANVVEGQVIGLQGNRGNSTGPHLHFSIVNNNLCKNGHLGGWAGCKWGQPGSINVNPDNINYRIKNYTPTCGNGISGNGLWDVNINICGAPYTTYAKKPGGSGAWAPGGASTNWYAAARVNELTGVDVPIMDGQTWINTAESYGFTVSEPNLDPNWVHGHGLASKGLVVWTDHIRVVEGVDTQAQQILYSNGDGNSSLAANGYCAMKQKSYTDFWSGTGNFGTFLGYVFLDKPNPKGDLNEARGTDDGQIHIYGWAYDPSSPDTDLDLRIQVKTPRNDFREYIEKVNNYQRVDLDYTKKGFLLDIPTDLRGENIALTVEALGTGSGKSLILGDGIKYITITADYPNKITLNQDSLDLRYGSSGGSYAYTPGNLYVSSYRPNDAINKKITWTSSDTSVAVVSSDGEVTPKSSGTAIITAAVVGRTSVKAECIVTVSPFPQVSPESIGLDKTNESVAIGSQFTLSTSISPSNADNKKINWSSSDTSVATVSNGVVTAVGEGSAVITAAAAADSSVKAVCNVTVYQEAEPSCEWVEKSTLPPNVNSDEWEIEIKNHYVQTGSVSPGAGWTQTAEETVRYENSGSVYESEDYYATTETRENLGYYYFHYCGNPANKKYVERFYDATTYPKKHTIYDYSHYYNNEWERYDDSRAPQYKQYVLRWVAETAPVASWANGIATCEDGGERWYRMYKYQNKVKVTYSTWMRDSEWLSLDQADSSATSISYRFRLKGCDAVSYTVTFKVTNGSWDDGTTADKTVTLEGIAADTLTLTEAQIPTAGTKPAANYKAGEWGVIPSTDTQITGDTTYTYTYAKKNSISSTVTFKVVNGSWDDGTAANKTVTLNGYEGDTLKLKAADIPAVGNKPATNYNSGSWDTTPSVDTAITGNKTFTYTYKAKSEVTRTVTFKVVNGSWDDGTTADKTVTLNGYEGDSLKLTQSQIPAVGSKPNETYKAGSWDTAPDTTTAITSNKSYTYTYAVDENDNRIKLIVSSESARPGEEVTVGVSIENNAGARAIYFVVSYDESKLLYEGFVNSGLEPWIRQGVGKGLLWQGSQDTDFNGEMVKLKFSVLEEFDEGETIVTLTDPDITDKDENDFSYVIESGKVTVIKYLKGDINGDGKVSVKDLVRLQSYILDKSVVVFGNPDTNGDEKVSVKDLVRLQKYILDKSVEIF